MADPKWTISTEELIIKAANGCTISKAALYYRDHGQAGLIKALKEPLRKS